MVEAFVDVTAINLTPDDMLRLPLPTGIPTAQSLSVKCPEMDRLVLIFTLAGPNYGFVTVQPGVSPPAIDNILGPLLFSASGTLAIGPFTSSRWQQADGSILLNFDGNVQGTFYALYLPRT